MLHFKKYYGDDQAACGATLYPGESTIYPNSVQCPACRARIKADSARQSRLQGCASLAEFDKMKAEIREEEKSEDTAAISCEIFENRHEYAGSPAASEKSFAVMLHPAPAFPDTQPTKDGVEQLAIFAANDDHGLWGWVNLCQEEKDCIGDELLKCGAIIGKWYWCILWSKSGPSGQLLPMGTNLKRLQDEGHTYHCACRIEWGDGECECGQGGKPIFDGR